MLLSWLAGRPPSLVAQCDLLASTLPWAVTRARLVTGSIMSRWNQLPALIHGFVGLIRANQMYCAICFTRVFISENFDTSAMSISPRSLSVSWCSQSASTCGTWSILRSGNCWTARVSSKLITPEIYARQQTTAQHVSLHFAGILAYLGHHVIEPNAVSSPLGLLVFAGQQNAAPWPIPKLNTTSFLSGICFCRCK